MTNLKNIVISWLTLHGYDGLYNDGECGCDVSDLMPCGEPNSDCMAGYKVDCPKDHEFDYMIMQHEGDECG